MDAGQYTTESPLWTLETEVDAGATVNYVYVRQQDCGQAPIYESINRTMDIAECGPGTKVVRGKWTGSVGSSGGC